MPTKTELSTALVPIDTVIPDPNQPRKNFGGPEDKELAANIKVHGLLQPIAVRPDGHGQLVIIAGERRYRACKALAWTEIPVTIHENIQHVQEAQISENLHRKNLTALEEARAYKKLLDDGLAQKDIAKRVNKSPAYISERLALLDLPEKVQELVLSGQLSFSHAKLLSKAPDTDVERIATEAAKNKTNVRDLKDKITTPTRRNSDKTSQTAPSLTQGDGDGDGDTQDPDALIKKARQQIKTARNKLDTALRTLTLAADTYQEHDQYKLADAAELLEQGDTILERFLKEPR